MGTKTRRVCLILLVGSVLFANSACNPRRSKKVDVNSFMDSVDKETHVEEWSEPVPDRMEIKYVRIREQRVDNTGLLNDYLFEYDDLGRQTAFMDVWENGSYRVEVTYNDNDTIAGMTVKNEGAQSTPTVDHVKVYTYNDMGQIISVTDDETRHNNTYKNLTEYTYDEQGRLIAVKQEGRNTYSRSFENNDETFPHSEYRIEFKPPLQAEFISSDYSPYKIVQLFYDEDGILVSKEEDDILKHFIYTDGVLTGSRSDGQSGYSLYDANGNLIESYSNTGSLEYKYEYNEHGDMTLSERRKDGVLESKDTWDYTYDPQGKILTRAGHYWQLDITEFSALETYSYDEHGLLIKVEDTIDGKFSFMYVYDYKAILVPVSSDS